MTEFLAKVRVLLGAVPALGAVVQGVIVSLGTLVPFLPIAWQAKAAAGLALAASWVATLVALVARVTPVPPEAIGLTLPPGRQMRVELVGPSFPAGHIPPT